ncbi:MAG: GspE/PulE family protein [Candidatus Omnitrophota bacterium]
MNNIQGTQDYFVGQLFIEEGIITQEQLALAQSRQQKDKKPICETIVEMGFSSQDKVTNALYRQLNTPYVTLRDKIIDHEVIQKVPLEVANHYKIVPLEFKDDSITVAMCNLDDFSVLDEIRLLLGMKVTAVSASESEIQTAIRVYYGVGAQTVDKMIAKRHENPVESIAKENIEEAKFSQEDHTIIHFVNQVLNEAVRSKATDIHLEPFQDELRTRFRIDGVLYDIHTSRDIRFFHPAIVSRIKIMANLDISEHRLPQDGRITLKINSQELDLRISILSTSHGEAVHIRILSPQSFLTLDKLGLKEEDRILITEELKKPHGLLLVAGPTGAGKSTTLYACLSQINLDSLKVITVEDPIEYHLRGINQIQINPKIGLSFATGLRHILRHDPDVMMVGEIRDYETAEIAIRAALTGHLVFSTLHTNDAASAVVRLVDMGIEPFLLSSSMECIISQRLVKLICPYCRKPLKPTQQMRELLYLADCQAANIEFYEGNGCKECRNTGYRGRTGIYEILKVNEDIKELIAQRATCKKIFNHAKSLGMHSLKQDGFLKAVRGITTLTEVLRVTQE